MNLRRLQVFTVAGKKLSMLREKMLNLHFRVL